MVQTEIHDLLAYDGVKIIQGKDMFRFSLDSLLLANFVNINYRARDIIDLGTGNAPIPLFLSLKTKKRILGVEIQDEAVALAEQSVKLNGLDDQIEIIKADIKDIYKIYKDKTFDIVVCNPPFFKFHNPEFVNMIENKTISRHEVLIDLESIIKSVTRIITNGRALNIIHRAQRLEEIIVLLDQHKFVIKRMQFVYTKPKKDALMVLIEARYNGRKGDLKILEPLYIYDDLGEYTESVKRIFHFGEEKNEK